MQIKTDTLYLYRKLKVTSNLSFNFIIIILNNENSTLTFFNDIDIFYAFKCLCSWAVLQHFQFFGILYYRFYTTF